MEMAKETKRGHRKVDLFQTALLPLRQHTGPIVVGRLIRRLERTWKRWTFIELQKEWR